MSHSHSRNSSLPSTKNQNPPSAVLIALAAHFLHIPHQLYNLSLVSKHFHRVLTEDEIWNQVVRYWFPDADSSSGATKSKGLRWWRHKWKHLWTHSCVTIQRQLLRTHFEELIGKSLEERRNLTLMWYDGPFQGAGGETSRDDKTGESNTGSSSSNKNASSGASSKSSTSPSNTAANDSRTTTTDGRSSSSMAGPLRRQQPLSTVDSTNQQQKLSPNQRTFSLHDPHKYNPKELGFFQQHSETARERTQLIRKFMTNMFENMEKDRSRFVQGMSISMFEIPMQYHLNIGPDSKKAYRAVRDVLCNPAKFKKSNQLMSGADVHAAVDERTQQHYSYEEHAESKNGANHASDTAQNTDPFAHLITFNMKPVGQSKQAKPIISDLTKIKASNLVVAEKIIEVGDRILKVLHQDDDTDTCHFAQVLQFTISQYHSTLIGARYKLIHHVNFVIVPPQYTQNPPALEKNYTLNKFCHELGTFKLKQLAYIDPASLTAAGIESPTGGSSNSKSSKKKKSSISSGNSSMNHRQQNASKRGNQESTNNDKKKSKPTKRKHFTLLGSVCEVSNLWTQYVTIVDADERDSHASKMINLKEYAIKQATTSKKKKKKNSS